MVGYLLLVDSDATSCARTAELLSKQGHSVIAVDNGPQALARTEASTFDAVLVAATLPEMDGLELLAGLQERLVDPGFLVMGGDTPPDTRHALQRAALEAGVLLEHVQSPTSEDELLLAVDRILERTALRRERARLSEENQAFMQAEGVRQRCLELLSSTDLEWVQERILWDLSALAGAQSAALWVVDERDLLVLRAWRGLIDRQQLPERIRQDAPELAPMAEGRLWRAGSDDAPVLCVPLMVDGSLMGLVQLTDPLGHPFDLQHAQPVQLLADFSGVAIRNARRFLALQRQGLRDRDTAAYNLSYFSDYASKEIYKARRYARTFSLVTFSLDQLEEVRQRLGPAEAKRAHRGVIRAISRITRDSDVLAKASAHEFYLLLPETDFFGALMFLRRAYASVREELDVVQVETQIPLGLTSGAATFPKDGEDFDELIHCSRNRMDERRGSLQNLMSTSLLPFWEQVELFLGTPGSPPLPEDPRADPSRRGPVAPGLFEEVQAEIARELLRDPQARGVLYVGGPEVRQRLPIVAGLERAPTDLGARIYLLGRRADLASHPALTPVFLEGDERIARHHFILWLTETSAYALLQRQGHAASWAFHSSDPVIVDGLIARLQATYDLQPF